MKRSIAPNYLLRLSCLLLIILSIIAQGAEDCSNQIDDDGDGFIDCYDIEDCGCQDGDDENTCECFDFFIGNSSCQADLPEDFDFDLNVMWESDLTTSQTLGRAAVGDIDNDGETEVITFNLRPPANENQNGATTPVFIHILNGETGETEHFDNVKSISSNQFNSTTIRHDLAIADTDGDGFGEIYIAANNFVMRIDHNLNPVWERDLNALAESPSEFPGLLGIADFDGNGEAEIYYRNEIIKASNGTALSPGFGDWDPDVCFGSVAYDILDVTDPGCDGNCAGLELIVCDKIYSVNTSNEPWVLTEVKNINTNDVNPPLPNNLQYYPKRYNGTKWTFSSASVADFNGDGRVDVLMMGAQANPSAQTSAYFWDVINGSVLSYDPLGYNWPGGGGRINVANLDADPELEATFATGAFLFILDNDFTEIARVPIIETTSGVTSSTVFDFNGDGASEVVYRDEENLYIINAGGYENEPVGKKLFTVECKSRTAVEYPIIADINNDGATELIVPCGYLEQSCNNCYTNSFKGFIRAFESNGEPWVASREVWNQHGYHGVNVGVNGDNLLIPTTMQSMVAEYADCDNDGVADQPFNSFLNQLPVLDDQGCLTFPAPDFQFSGPINYTSPQCPETDFDITFQIVNLGNTKVQGNISVSWYANVDPNVDDQAVALGTDTFVIGQGDDLQTTDISFTVNGPPNLTNYTLYIRINDPLSSDFNECDVTNNTMSIPINIGPFDIIVEKLKDHEQCDPAPIGNGQAKAYVMVDGQEETNNFTFTWYTDAALTQQYGVAEHTKTDLLEGTYYVIAEYDDNLITCTYTNAMSINIAEVNKTYDTELLEVFNQEPTNCVDPGEIEIHLKVNDILVAEGFYNGNPYLFEWYEGNTFLQFGHHVSLPTGTYELDVIDTQTSCVAASGQFTIGDPRVDFPEPSAIIIDVQSCINIETGEIHAYVDESGNPNADPNDYELTLYNGYGAIDGNQLEPPLVDMAFINGNNYKRYFNLPAGAYSLSVKDLNSECDAVTTLDIDIGDPPYPSVTNVVPTSQTSCIATAPNGELEATIVGNVSDHTFEWYLNGTILMENGDNNGAVAGADTEHITGLLSGTYYLTLIDNATQCSVDAGPYVVDDGIVLPQISIPQANIAAQTVCGPPNGSILAIIDIGDPADYTFTWYYGQLIEPDSLIAGETDEFIEDIEGGRWYTVTAINNIDQCQASQPQSAFVPSNIPVLDISITSNGEAGDCNNPQVSILLSVEINGQAPAPGELTYQWYYGDVLLPGETNESLINVPAGGYNLEVTHVATGCIYMEPYILEPWYISPITIEATTTSNTSCNGGNGEIEVSITNLADFGIGTVISDFEFNWYEGNVVKATQPGCLDPFDFNCHNPDFADNDHILSDLEPGEYTVEAIFNGPSACISLPLTVTIIDESGIPKIQAQQGPIINTNCSSNTYNGNISLTVNKADPDDPIPFDPTDYTLTWYTGTTQDIAPANEIPLLANQYDVNVGGGSYTVVVAHNISLCSDSVTFVVNDQIEIPEVTLLGTSAQTTCVDLGSIEVNPSTANVEFYWYTDNTLMLEDYQTETFDDHMVAELNNDSLDNLVAGEYYLIIKDLDTDCISYPYVYEVADEIQSFTVTFSSTPQVNCDLNNPDGTLEATISNGVGPDFYIEWYSGIEVTQGGLITSGTNVNQISGLAEGYYMAVIEDLGTNCIDTTSQYYLREEMNDDIKVLTGSKSLTNCGDPDGSVSALAYSSLDINTTYTYEWYTASQTPGVDQPIASTAQVTGLPLGIYQVRARDLNDLACVSETATVEVTDARAYPTLNLDATTSSPNTMCYEYKTNGELSVRVLDFIDDGITDYTFEWSASDNPGWVAYGHHITGLKADVTYSVTITNKYSECTSIQQYSFNIEDSLPVIPPPDLEVLAIQTSCDPVNPNGSITITDPDENLFYYEVYAPDNSLLGSDIILQNLGEGTYYAKAIDYESGCESALASIEVTESLTTPTFDIRVAPASCNLANGVIYVDIDPEFMEGANVYIDNLYTNEVLAGPATGGLETGSYEVTVIDANGCMATDDVFVPNDIHIYNGISANNDGKNDFFNIDCIEDFNESNVIIFNRYGTKVFQTDRYDNNDPANRFEGTCNINLGIKTGSGLLPSGAYYYIINYTKLDQDLNPVEARKAGYLQLEY